MVDSETGLYYLMSRYYDPSIGQFISEDSYRGDGEAFWHLYAYCDGDPVNKVDRNGHYASGVKWKKDGTVLRITVRYYSKIDASFFKSNSERTKFKNAFNKMIVRGINKWSGTVRGRTGYSRIALIVSQSSNKKGSLRIRGIKSSDRSTALRVGYNNQKHLSVDDYHMKIRYLTDNHKFRKSNTTIKNTVTHEFGHILGLSDAYEDAEKHFTNKAIDNSVMRHNEDGPSDQDRRLVVDSYKYGQKFKGGYN